MKNLLFITVAILVFANSSYAQIALINLEKTPESKVEWENKQFDFGIIEKNKSVSTQFSFKNASNESILIEKVKTSCGCTATKYPKTPIAPGETASITVSYNAKTSGNFSKTVWVNLNTNESPAVLKITGVVN